MNLENSVKRKADSSDEAVPIKIRIKSIYTTAGEEVEVGDDGAPAAEETASAAGSATVAAAAESAAESSAGDSRQGGEVLTLGTGDMGQLGLGPDIVERLTPALVSGLADVVQVAAGGMHTVCLTRDGRVFTFGCNDEGALGRVAEEDDVGWTPGMVQLPGRALQVSAGDSHTAALLDDGLVYAWGCFRDLKGPMGLLTESLNSYETEPQLIVVKGNNGLNKAAVKIASGDNHMLILTCQGEVYSCGCGEQGQLGRLASTFATRDNRLGLRRLLTPALVTAPRFVCDEIFTGHFSSYIRQKSTGRIYVFGLNNYSQLGLENTREIYYRPGFTNGFSSKNFSRICGGQHHCLALSSSGTVHSLGRREYGLLGLGQVPDDPNDAREPTLIPALGTTNCVDIACGPRVSFAVTEDGRAYAWGMGSNGQLGTGDEDDRHEPALMVGQQLQGRRVLAVTGGGLHTVMLATPKPI